MLQEIKAIISKDLRMEWRQKHALGSIFLYVIASIFVAYMGFKQIVDVPTWNALFWIIVLFAAFNAAARSFSVESSGRRLYLFTLARPESVIIGKMLYNAFLLLVMVFASFAAYALMLGTGPLENANWGSVALALTLGAVGLGFTLTLVSALAAQTDNNLGLMAVLGLPVILPMLLILIRFSKNAIDGIAWSQNGAYAWQLLAISVMSLGLSYILFPYLWRE
ncbi:ABC transporter permease [Cryomorpha ignava]|uniref:ABC transporter permease n=1 Tax=Cryomorpha ignava TaxID=101383 RepID=A0A7K3WR58_9FLAO|nr:heme exporter protein CcmB [Cryomorpha ignava]NEN23954.1 ABC transporter permease [Cryomorpha ignava]